MKTFKASRYLSAQELHQYLTQNLNTQFRTKVKKDVMLQIILTEDKVIEIGQPEFYESFLYKIIVNDSDIQLIKSEHYVDDVYNLALEDIVLSLIETYIGEDDIESIEGEISG